MTVCKTDFTFKNLLKYQFFYSFVYKTANSAHYVNCQMLPFYIMDRLGTFHGVPGLFLASLFAGALRYVSKSRA